VVRRFRRLIQRIRREPFRALAVTALLVLIGAGAGLVAMQGWAAWQCHRAERAIQQREFAQAYGHYGQVLKIWSGRPWVHLEAARAARRAGLFPQALEQLDRCQALQGGGVSRDLQVERLLLRAQVGDLAEIEGTLYDFVKEGAPETSLILEALAQGYRSQLRWVAALGCLGKLLEREPNNVWAHSFRGQLLVQADNYPEGAEALRKALELNPAQDDARLALAQALLRLDPKEALSHFQYLRTKGDQAPVLLGLAQAYRTIGEPEKVAPILDTLLAKYPDDVQALLERGALLLEEGQAAEAEGWLRKAVAADPTFAMCHHQLARALEHQGGPKEAEAKRYRVLAKKAEADTKRLAEIAKRELSLQPNNPDLYYEVGAIFLHGQQQKQQALAWLYRALKLDPNHQPTHELLARYYEENREPEMAKKHRQRLRPAPASQAGATSPPS
jgi:predicted Zn-dependent protease